MTKLTVSSALYILHGSPGHTLMSLNSFLTIFFFAIFTDSYICICLFNTASPVIRITNHPSTSPSALILSHVLRVQSSLLFSTTNGWKYTVYCLQSVPNIFSWKPKVAGIRGRCKFFSITHGFGNLKKWNAIPGVPYCVAVRLKYSTRYYRTTIPTIQQMAKGKMFHGCSSAFCDAMVV